MILFGANGRRRSNSFLIAQSLNQIEKAYGPNNAILDNCHVRVAFATNDERTARRISDALGTATDLRAMKNYAGSRLSPWLGHLMVSRQETALLTPGEVMQLPPSDELVLVSGIPPIRARKARYYENVRLKSRVLPPPALTPASARRLRRPTCRPCRRLDNSVPPRARRGGCRRPAPWPTRILRMGESAASPPCPSAKRSRPSRHHVISDPGRR